jgi:CspA family cold shock protein
MARPTTISTPTTTITGTIRKLVRDKGFGFVSGADGTDYFFYRDAVEGFDTLAEGTAVVFVPGEGPKGPRAQSVSVA